MNINLWLSIWRRNRIDFFIFILKSFGLLSFERILLLEIIIDIREIFYTLVVLLDDEKL
jgi:hypothetical protein